MHPDQGCYQERYRLTFPVARSAAISLVSLIPVIFSHQPLPWVILSPVGLPRADAPATVEGQPHTEQGLLGAISHAIRPVFARSDSAGRLSLGLSRALATLRNQPCSTAHDQ
jgi:hypothetical protein